jgi:hypothetical protein
MRWVSLTSAVFALSACSYVAPPGPVTRIDNQSGTAWIIETIENGVSYYQRSDPGTIVVVDSIGEANPPAEQLRLFTFDCKQDRVLARPAPIGGVFVLRESGAIERESVPHSGARDDRALADRKADCKQAASN